MAVRSGPLRLLVSDPLRLLACDLFHGLSHGDVKQNIKTRGAVTEVSVVVGKGSGDRRIV